MRTTRHCALKCLSPLTILTKTCRRYSNQSVPLTKSTNRSEEATEDESSDYAYIDRSTHSITGYLNQESSKQQTVLCAEGGDNCVLPRDLIMRQGSGSRTSFRYLVSV